MKTINLHDPTRRRSWLDEIMPGEHLVFLRDAATFAERNAEGHPLRPGEASVCVVFPTLQEARSFCERKCRDIARLRCDVYDHRGLADRPLYTYGKKEWDPKPKPLFLVATLLVLISIPLFWWDWNHRGELLWPSLIGINLVAIALRLLFWALGKIDQQREDAARTS